MDLSRVSYLGCVEITLRVVSKVMIEVAVPVAEVSLDKLRTRRLAVLGALGVR